MPIFACAPDIGSDTIFGQPHHSRSAKSTAHPQATAQIQPLSRNSPARVIQARNLDIRSCFVQKNVQFSGLRTGAQIPCFKAFRAGDLVFKEEIWTAGLVLSKFLSKFLVSVFASENQEGNRFGQWRPRKIGSLVHQACYSLAHLFSGCLNLLH